LMKMGCCSWASNNSKLECWSNLSGNFLAPANVILPHGMLLSRPIRALSSICICFGSRTNAEIFLWRSVLYSPLVDMSHHTAHVRLWRPFLHCKCPLLAQGGHWRPFVRTLRRSALSVGRALSGHSHQV